MSTAFIVKENIESTAHNNIFAYIDNRNYVKDPRSVAGVSSRIFVYDTDPFHKAINFSDMPYIVVELPAIEQSLSSASGTKKRVEWTQRITVRAVKTGSANTRTDVGRDDMFAIGDSLFSLFNNMTRKKELQALNILDIDIKKTNFDSFTIQQKEVYEAEYEIIAWSRVEVSD